MRGLMTPEDMQNLIQIPNIRLWKTLTTLLSKHLKDPEPLFVDDLLNNSILNELLTWEGYAPSQHVLLPWQLFRAELLKSLKFPELSYRRFCEEQVKPRSQSANRTRWLLLNCQAEKRS